MNTWSVDTTAKDTAESLICLLANSCNHAQSLDGFGFSRNDAEFGHSLANRARANTAWTVKQAHAALKLLQKYQRQLNHLDVNEWLKNPIFANKPMDNTTTIAVRKLTSCDNMAVFAFTYDSAIVNDIKLIRGVHRDKKFWASFNSASKTWTVPVNKTSIALIMSVATRYDFEVESRFTSYLEKIKEKNLESRTMLQLNGNRNIILSSNSIDIYVEDAAVLDEFVKELNSYA
jgi:hypothetical protein